MKPSLEKKKKGKKTLTYNVSMLQYASPTSSRTQSVK